MRARTPKDAINYLSSNAMENRILNGFSAFFFFVGPSDCLTSAMMMMNSLPQITKTKIDADFNEVQHIVVVVVVKTIERSRAGMSSACAPIWDVGLALQIRMQETGIVCVLCMYAHRFKCIRSLWSLLLYFLLAERTVNCLRCIVRDVLCWLRTPFVRMAKMSARFWFCADIA